MLHATVSAPSVRESDGIKSLQEDWLSPLQYVGFAFNPSWSQIIRNPIYRTNQPSSDMALVVAQMFRAKVDAFDDYLRGKVPFGPYNNVICIMEYKKRRAIHSGNDVVRRG